LFAPSLDRIDDQYTDENGQTFYKIHFPNSEKPLENIHVVACLANVQCKASTDTIQERYNEFKTKEVEQCKKDFKKVLEISKKATVRGKNTPLYNHAASIWRRDEKCVYDIAGVINRENCIIHLAVHIC
jgi:hypothetical protein